MRILHVVDHLKRYNGMVHAAVDLACQQARDGHSVAVWSGGGDLAETLRDNDVALFAAPAVMRLPAMPAALFSMRRAVAAFGPDILHAHMVRSASLAWIASRLSRLALVTSVQNASTLASLCMTIGDGLVTGCDAVRERMIRRGVPAGKLRSVLNGTIGSARLASAAPEPIVLQRPALLTICGLHRRKGVDLLIEAFAMCRTHAPESHLYIVGDGPDRAAYEQRVADLALANVHFCGYVADTRAVMAAADVFVLASRADPAPLVISEARDAGLAVVATDVDGIPEMLDHGRAGLLVRAGSVEDLAATLASLLSTPGALDLWRRRSRRALERLSVARVAAETVLFYKGFVTAGRSDPLEAIVPEDPAPSGCLAGGKRP